MDIEKITVYVITGFLGSGKTTLLNNLLREYGEEKNIVIENEFGKINIDATLISAKHESLFELTNGCICCSLNHQLLNVLQDIAQLKKGATNLFIETTGIADVGEIAAVFEIPIIKKQFSLKKIICVVDALNYESNNSEVAEINRQIVNSDLIVLNKTEHVNKKASHNLKTTVKNQNPFAQITLMENSKIDTQLLAAPNSSKINLETTEIEKETHPIKSILYETDACFDVNMLKHTILKTLFLSYNQLYRIKGYVKTSNHLVYLIQSVGKTVTATLLPGKTIDKSQLVIIGKSLTRKSVERLMNTSTVKPPPSF